MQGHGPISFKGGARSFFFLGGGSDDSSRPLPRCQQGQCTLIRPPPSFPLGWGGAGRGRESPPRILHRVGCQEGAARPCTPQPHLLPPSWSSIWRQVRSGEGNPEVHGGGGAFPRACTQPPQLSLCSPGFPPQEAAGGRRRGGPQAWAPPSSARPRPRPRSRSWPRPRQLRLQQQQQQQQLQRLGGGSKGCGFEARRGPEAQGEKQEGQEGKGKEKGKAGAPLTSRAGAGRVCGGLR